MSKFIEVREKWYNNYDLEDGVEKWTISKSLKSVNVDFIMEFADCFIRHSVEHYFHVVETYDEIKELIKQA